MRLFPLLLLSLTMSTAHAQHPASASPAPSQATAVEVPAAPDWLPALDALYDAQLRAPGLERRDFQPEHWWQVAMPYFEAGRGFTVEQIGQSVEGRPLRHVRWGNGPVKVLLWSQMHGDESTASMSLVDLARWLGEHPQHPLVTRLRERTTLHLFPVVNPDGAARFQRRNAQGIDINRDAANLASPEARTLKALHDRVRPHYGFNLHDQQVGYRAGDSERGTAIALLSPPFDHASTVNDVRARAMGVAASIRTALEPYIPGHIARWDDEFNPLAFGDLTTQWGTSTVLIESGGIDGDREKQLLRKLNFLALAAGLVAIADDRREAIALYASLPENGKVWPDLALRGGTVVWPGKASYRADVLVRFRNPLTGSGGNITDVGDLSTTAARQDIDATGLYLVPVSAADRVVTGAAARFHVSRDPEGKDVVWTLDGDLPDALLPAPRIGRLPTP